MTKKAEAIKEPKPLDIPNLKVFDVSHPGKSAPSHTARPVIVGNRPILKDPMVVDDAVNTESAEKTSLSPTATKVVIKPIDHDEADKEPETAPVEAQPADVEPAAEPAAPEAPTPEPAAEAAPQQDDSAAEEAPEKPDAASEEVPKPETSPEPAEPENSPTDSETTTKSAKELAKQEEVAQKAAERQAELDKLIDSKKYYLPVNVVQKRRTAWVLSLVVLVLVLAAVGVELAMDAGLLHVGGLQPFTHFFNN